MKKAMKVLGILLCAVLLVVGSVAATLAYLTAKESITNTFTIGDVALKLDEAEYENGKLTGERTEDTNNYHLVPGSSFTKDPTVTVLAGSDESYVRMTVTIAGATWAQIVPYISYNGTSGYNTTEWALVSDTVNAVKQTIDGKEVDTYTYVFNYKNKVNTSTSEVDQKLGELFDTIAIPNDIATDDLTIVRGMKQMHIEAHAIQADGFEDDANMEAEGAKSAIAKAWAAFDLAYAES